MSYKERVLYKLRENDLKYIRIGTLINYEVKLDTPKRKELDKKPQLFYSEWYKGIDGEVIYYDQYEE
jgi:hypothetical protein